MVNEPNDKGIDKGIDKGELVSMESIFIKSISMESVKVHYCDQILLTLIKNLFCWMNGKLD